MRGIVGRLRRRACDCCSLGHDHSFAVALPASEYRFQHLVGIVAIDHPAQELPHRIRAGSIELAHRAVDAIGLQAGELGYQRLALRGGEKKAFAAVLGAGLLDDIPFIEQLLENPAQRLLCDAQHVEQVGHLQPGIAVDEMDDAVVRAPEAEFLQHVVGIADEIPIGEEQQLDDIPAQNGRTGAGRGLASLLRSSHRKIYVNHIDISWVQYYKTESSRRNIRTFATAGPKGPI